MNEKITSYGVLLLIFALVVTQPQAIATGATALAGGVGSIVTGIAGARR
jgi:hypothetical protein